MNRQRLEFSPVDLGPRVSCADVCDAEYLAERGGWESALYAVARWGGRAFIGYVVFLCGALFGWGEGFVSGVVAGFLR